LAKLEGSKVRSLREGKGLTQEQLAKLTGFCLAYISKIESNKINSPSYEAVTKIAEALRVEPKEILAKKVS
jgi:transcriptional regulator with XRE-family HTH domain